MGSHEGRVFFDKLGCPDAEAFCAGDRKAKDATVIDVDPKRRFFIVTEVKADLREAIGKADVLMKRVGEGEELSPELEIELEEFVADETVVSEHLIHAVMVAFERAISFSWQELKDLVAVLAFAIEVELQAVKSFRFSTSIAVANEQGEDLCRVDQKERRVDLFESESFLLPGLLSKLGPELLIEARARHIATTSR